MGGGGGWGRSRCTAAFSSRARATARASASVSALSPVAVRSVMAPLRFAKAFRSGALSMLPAQDTKCSYPNMFQISQLSNEYKRSVNICILHTPLLRALVRTYALHCC